MIILIDNREKAAYEFKHPTETVTLPVGDYSIKGFEGRVAIERKSGSDLFASLSAVRERRRFEAELFKGQGLHFFGLVIEQTFGGLADGNGNRSRSSAGSALKDLMHLAVQYRLPIFFAGSRIYGRWIVQSLLEKYWSELVKTAEAVNRASEMPRQRELI